MKRLAIICFAGCVYLSSCNQAGPAAVEEKKDTVPAFDIMTVRTAIVDANKAFCDAAMKGDSSAIAAAYTSNAHLMFPNMPVVTDAQGIMAAAASLAKQKVPGFTLETTDVFGNADNVIEEGKYTFTDSKGKVLEQGKYLTVWRQENGKWKLYRDIYNTDMPLPKAGK